MQASNIPLHTGTAAEHVRQALDYRQASEGDALSARYEAESFRAAHRANIPQPEPIGSGPTWALVGIAAVLAGMLLYAAVRIGGSL